MNRRVNRKKARKTAKYMAFSRLMNRFSGGDARKRHVKTTTSATKPGEITAKMAKKGRFAVQ